MSDNKDDFWKELMGDDFELPKDDIFGDKPETPSDDLGFSVEYVGRDGENLRAGQKETPQTPPEPQIPAEKTPEPPQQRRAPASQKPVPQGQNDGPKRPTPAGQNGDSQRKSPKDPADDFEVDFDFDKEYEDVEEKPVRRGRTKRTGCLGGVMFFLFIICISAVLACVGWIAATDVLGLGGESGVVEVTIPKEVFTETDTQIENEDGSVTTTTVAVADMDAVSGILHDEGLIKYQWLFKLFSKFSHADQKVKAGTYQLNYNYDYRALVNGMTPTGGKKVEIDITIPEGYTITQIVDLLVTNNVCDKVDLMDALANYDFQYDFLDSSTLGQAKRLEGFLFPDTYTFYVGDTATRVINKMLTNFEGKWTDEYKAQAESLGYTAQEIMTIASMIEKEAGADSERATIASVIYNRLKNPGTQGTVGLLQIDATIYYVIADTGEEFSTEIDSPYNTYRYQGLTPGPIANPGIASIKAALYPESTSYYYYALGLDGLHQFFKTYDSFTAFINSDEYGG